MKTKLKSLLLTGALLFAAVASHAQGLNAQISAAAPKASQFITLSLTTGSSVAIVSTNLMYTTATFYGYSAVSGTASPTANSGNALIGFCAKNAAGTFTGTNMVDTLAAGSSLTIQAPSGTKYDLRDIRFNGGTGDKVFIVFEQ